MPIVGIIFGEPSFNNLTLTINNSIIYYGSFITAVVRFLAIAPGSSFSSSSHTRLTRSRTAADEEEAPAEPSDDIKLLTEIRDALNK